MGLFGRPSWKEPTFFQNERQVEEEAHEEIEAQTQKDEGQIKVNCLHHSARFFFINIHLCYKNKLSVTAQMLKMNKQDHTQDKPCLHENDVTLLDYWKGL